MEFYSHLAYFNLFENTLLHLNIFTIKIKNIFILINFTNMIDSGLNIYFKRFLLFGLIAILPACKTDKQAPKERLSKAIYALNEAIGKSPKDASLFYKRGLEFQKLQKDSIALLDFQKACELDSTKAEYYSAAGDLLFENKDVSSSVSYLQKALLINPNDVKAQLKVAKLFLFLGEHTKVFIAINNVLRTDVYNEEAYFLKGMTYKDMQDTNDAINSFATASKINPDKAEYLMQLGLMSAKVDKEKAILYYKNAYKKDTTNLEPLNGIGIIYQESKENTKAKEAFLECIKIDKDYAKAYYNIGCILMDEDSTDKALRQFDYATKYNPQYTEAYFNRGLCYEIKGELERAAADFNQALVFDPAYSMALQALKRIGK